MKFDVSVQNGIAWEYQQKYSYLRDKISAGSFHTVAVMPNKTVKYCGMDGRNLTNVSNWTNIEQVACGVVCALGLRDDGSVCFTGDLAFFATEAPECEFGTPINQWEKVKKVYVNYAYDCYKSTAFGLTEDGCVYAYGCNEFGQAEVGGWNNIVDVTPMKQMTIGLREDGTVVSCGSDSLIKNKISTWEDMVRIFPCGENNVIGINRYGKVFSTMESPQFDVSGWNNIIDISTVGNILVGLRNDGYICATGDIDYLLEENLSVVNNVCKVVRIGVFKDIILMGVSDGRTFLVSKGVNEIGTLCQATSVHFCLKPFHEVYVFESGEVAAVTIVDQMDRGQSQTSGWNLMKIPEETHEVQNTLPSNTSTQQNNTTQQTSSSTGCYVATCVYGSYDCPEVWTLRRYRDYTLASTWYGRAFIRTYYAISPTLVKWFGHTEWFKKLWKGKLDSMVSKLNTDGVDNTPYNDIKW